MANYSKKNIKKDKTKLIEKILKKRILYLDGAMGTMIQNLNLSESDFRGNIFNDHYKELKGNNDILSITQPETIKNIHLSFLESGADIIETNTFNANRVSQDDYALGDKTFDINLSSSKLAVECIKKFSSENKPRFVAGVLGPTNKTRSISPDITIPDYR